MTDNDFIMSFRDFIAYMEYVCICSQTPVTNDDDPANPHQSKCQKFELICKPFNRYHGEIGLSFDFSPDDLLHVFD